MSKLSNNICCQSAVILGVALMMAKSAIAADTIEIPKLKINRYTQEINTTPPKSTQQSRTEAPSPSGGYGCLRGDRSGNYQGNRAVSRYEFAARLNACTDQINRLLNTTTSNFATKQDLNPIQSQLEGDRSQLDNLRNRVDRLERLQK